MQSKTIALKKPIRYEFYDLVIEFTKLHIATYPINGNLGVILAPENDDPSQETVVSVNLPHFSSDDNYFTLDANNTIVMDVVGELVDQGFIKKTELQPIRSGFVQYPIYQLTV